MRDFAVEFVPRPGKGTVRPEPNPGRPKSRPARRRAVVRRRGAARAPGAAEAHGCGSGGPSPAALAGGQEAGASCMILSGFIAITLSILLLILFAKLEYHNRNDKVTILLNMYLR